jgi:hypothetical protein
MVTIMDDKANLVKSTTGQRQGQGAFGLSGYLGSGSLGEAAACGFPSSAAKFANARHVLAKSSHPFGQSDLLRRSAIEQRIPCQLTRASGPQMIVEPISRPVLGGLQHDYPLQLLERPSHRRAA